MISLRDRLVIVFVALLLLPATCLATVSIKEATITTDIVNKNPVDSIMSMPLNGKNIRLYAYTNVTTTVFPTKIVHVWCLEDNIIAEITLDINAQSWRTYSSKIITKSSVGNWSVYIFDATDSTTKNNLLEKVDFKIY